VLRRISSYSEQLRVVRRGREGPPDDRLGDVVARVVLEGAAHRGHAGVAALGRGEVDLRQPERRARARLRGHRVVGRARDALEQLDLTPRVAAGRRDAGQAHPCLDHAVALLLDAAVDVRGLVVVVELALDDLRHADQQVGRLRRVGLAPRPVDQRQQGVDVALALPEPRRLLARRLVQLGRAGRVLQRLQAQPERLVALAGRVERVGQLAEQRRLRLAFWPVGQARAQHADQQRRVAAGAQGPLQLAGLAVVLQRRGDRLLEQLGGRAVLTAARREPAELVLRLADADRQLVVASDRTAARGQQQGAVGPLGAREVAVLLGQLGQHLQRRAVGDVHAGGQLELGQRLDAVALGAGQGGQLGVDIGALGRAAPAEVGEHLLEDGAGLG
jgi:hypothetical protein